MQMKLYPHDHRYKVYSNGKIRGPKGRLLKSSLNFGYEQVAIGGKTKKVHRIVCETFLDIDESRPDVNHKNGIKTDNRLINLEWSNDSENISHAFRTGLKTHVGENNTRNKIPSVYIPIIRDAIAVGFNPKLIAKYFSVHKNTIYQIKYNENWTHIK